ncbi:FT-interacting protein 3-like [Populus alba x Populus x berolinensis]|uniref:FT-interacting protein 3-like n=1 Tax=Populus alba x Populus x berolinensis TaxID=444605 RepID=A0AAD6PP89_9ROSI|nr:FT-interacting protein 3-like [Populus alba x Populus x berolinensis]
MAKLIVEVHDACDLMPKDGQGSASPFVEVHFDEQRQRTQTKPRELNPIWNEKFSFNVNNPRDLPSKTIEVVVYNDRKGGHHKNFLGHVRISGNSVPLLSDSEAIDLQRYPLEKPLKIYAVHDGNHYPPPPTNAGSFETEATPVFQEINTNKLQAEDAIDDHEKKNKKKRKDKEVRTFHSIGTATGGPAAAAPPFVSSGFGFDTHVMKEKAPTVETRTDFARAGPPTAMHMHLPKQNPEFLLVETRPPVAARMRFRGGDKMACNYDLVEQMRFLYVSVVKAKDLPAMDVSGSLDPYVEVKLGNYKGKTKYLEKNQSPVWKQIFAFSKDRLQSNLLEVTVKDKDFVTKDDFVGRVFFDLSEVPLRVPPDSPLAPQWYRLEDKRGIKTRGEIMLAVWMGTQADESFPEAWHSDAHDISHTNLANTRSKVYFSPKLYYLRVQIIEAQDLIPSDKGRMLEVSVKVQLTRTTNPIWNDELMFVASEPFEDFIIVSVEERIAPGKDEILGKVILSVRDIPPRFETHKFPDPCWFNLFKPSLAQEEGEKKKDKFSSKILLRLCLDAGYHVLDEATHFSSDLQPSSKHLRKPSIGILELGILSARNLLPMKGKDGRTTDAYCAAKYGNKWVRTRTILNTLNPRWNEQYTWEVYDPCTVITIGVFDNCHINGSKDDSRDQRIGKVRIRLSTLETDRKYTYYYPLLVLTPSGLRKHGELHLSLRFTCTAWVNMVAQYGKPLLPKMHYVQPISVKHIDWLRHQAMQIVAARLSRAEPPLRREVVEYILDVDYHMWSLRRSKANFLRIMSLLSGITAACKWYNDICNWRNPITTCLVHVLLFILVCYPELILPTVFLYLFVVGLWNYRFRPRHPPHMDTRLSQADSAHPDELDEEFDSMRYDRLRSVAGRVQTVVGDLASQGERAQALLGWRDPRATAIFILFSLIWAVFIYVTPFQVVAVLVGLYLLRHPRFRSKMPAVPVNFFKRLPSKSDILL